ncbi:MAG: septum site-determining protein MinC [Propylenella sp.]
MALVFAPEPPLDEWMAELDQWSKRSPGYFVGRPIILDVSALPLDKDGVASLIADLHARDIRIMGVEGTKASWLGLGMPPLVSSGRATSAPGAPDAPPLEAPQAPKPAPKAAAAAAKEPATDAPAANGKAATALTAPPAPQQSAQPSSLLHDKPVRSGQSVIFPQGDLTILGSVASGSEVVAGGSIHIYGTLRGRAIAGSTGNSHARIFCNKLEAELIAIDGLYRTADEMEPQYRGRPVQAWLEGETMAMATLS